MGKFNEYTQKATPADNDTLMIYDATSKANKLSPFSGIWNWIVGKLTNAVINNLQTNNKTVLGAINELNSKASKVFLEHVETGAYNKFKIIAKTFTPIFMVGVSGGSNHYAGTIFIGDSGCFSATIIGSNVEVTYVSNGAVIVSCEMYANLIVLSGSPCTIEKVN